MAIKTALLSCLFLCGCLHGQYRTVVAGAGQVSAFIAENPSIGTNGSCYATRTTDPTTHILHDTARMCGAFDAAGYPNARLTVQTVTGDSAYQINSTFKALGFITGDTAPPSWYTPPDYYTDVVSATNQAHAILDGNTGTNLIFRIGNLSAGNKVWDIATGTAGGQSAMFFRVLDDAHLTQATWLQVVRTGNTIGSVTFPEVVTTQGLAFLADNTYNIGSGTVAPRSVFAIGIGVGREGSLQGTLSIANTSANPAPFTMAGTTAATGGSDVVVGNLFGASSIYPVNASTDLGYSGSRYRKIWVTDIDVAGTCTGCVAGGANTSLSNLTNPTSINQNLLFSFSGFNVGSLTTEVGNVYSRSYSAGAPSVAGGLSVYNGSNSNSESISGASTTGTSVDLQIGNPFFAGSIYGLGNVTLGNSSFPWSTLYVTNVNVGGLTGFTGTKTAGTCVISVSSGIITGISGC